MTQTETERDRNHLRALFLLRAHETPVGPSSLSELMDISRAGALQKMRKLEKLGYGRYVKEKGLQLTDKAVETVKKDIEKHHALELFLQKTLDLTQEEACEEAIVLEEHASERLLSKVYNKFREGLSCECGNCIDVGLDTRPEELLDCHWLKKKFDLKI